MKEHLRRAFYQGFITGKYQVSEFPVGKFEEWFETYQNSLQNNNQ